MRRSNAVGMGLLVLLGAAGAGCAMREKVTVSATGAPAYQRLHIAYDVSDVELTQADELPILRSVAHATVIEEGKSQPGCRVRLEVEYPYPGVHAEFARATLRVLRTASSGSADSETRKPKEAEHLKGFSNSGMRGDGLIPRHPIAGSPTSVDEALFIDFPKSQLDALFYDLAHAGFFDRPERASGEVHLEVVYNTGQIDKGWSREPRLDDLVDMLKRYGTPTTVPSTK